jgi:hypothetical protein
MGNMGNMGGMPGYNQNPSNFNMGGMPGGMMGMQGGN